jgi:hypothetical protein
MSREIGSLRAALTASASEAECPEPPLQPRLPSPFGDSRNCRSNCFRLGSNYNTVAPGSSPFTPWDRAHERVQLFCFMSL